MRKYKFQRQFLQTAVPLLLTVSIMLTGCGQTGNSDSPVRQERSGWQWHLSVHYRLSLFFRFFRSTSQKVLL